MKSPGLDPFRPGPLGAGAMNSLRSLLLGGRVRTAPPLEKLDTPAGQVIRDATPRGRWFKLSGGANPYAGAEQYYDASAGMMAAVPGAAAVKVYESRSLGGLNGKILWADPDDYGDYRGTYNRRGGGAAVGITVSWCRDESVGRSDVVTPGPGEYGGRVPGATVTLKNPDGSTFAVAITDASGVALFTGVPASATYTFTVTTTDPGTTSVSGSVVVGTGPAYAANVALPAPAGWTCACEVSCPWTILPTTLYLTNWLGTCPLTFFAGGTIPGYGFVSSGWFGCLPGPGSPGLTPPCTLGDVAGTYYFALRCASLSEADTRPDDVSPPFLFSTSWLQAGITVNLGPAPSPSGPRHLPDSGASAGYGGYSGGICFPPAVTATRTNCPPGSTNSTCQWSWIPSIAGTIFRQNVDSACHPFYLAFPRFVDSGPADAVITFGGP